MVHRFFFVMLWLTTLQVIFLFADFPPNLENELKIPDHFIVKQHWVSWTNTFDIENASTKLGTVRRRFLSLTVEYDFYDPQDKLQANAKMRCLSFGTVFDVTDKTGKLMGTTEQRIFRLLPTFEIFSPEKHSLAIAKMNFWETTYTLYDSETNEKFAVLTRPMVRWRDTWHVTITDSPLFIKKKIDPRLFLIIIAYQTDIDFWAHHARQLKKDGKLMHIEGLAAVNANQAEWIELREKLENYRPIFEGQRLTKSDFLYVESYIEEYLTHHLDLTLDNKLSMQESSNQEWDNFLHDYATYQENKIYEGIQAILFLLESHHLTIGQKRALFSLIDTQLKQWIK